MKKIKSSCPVERSLEIINGKWKICILWKLYEKNHRFGELKKSIPDITIKMLSQQLKELEFAKFINRKDYHTIPPKVEYSLTELGKSSIPILNSLHHWGKSKKRTIDKVVQNNYPNVVNL